MRHTLTGKSKDASANARKNEAMKTFVAGLSMIFLGAFLCASGVTALCADEAGELVTPERLARDELLKTYLSRGCALVYTVKTTIEHSVVDGPLKAYDTNGVKVLEWNFKAGVRHGESLAYYTSGRLSSLAFYECGVEQGAELYWNEDGSLYRTAAYSKGEKHGLETYWSRDGAITTRIDWREGEVRNVELYEAGVLKKRFTGDAAKNFFRDKGHEAARKLLEKKP